MKLLGLVLFAFMDVGLRLFLNKYVFKEMMRAWQFWGGLLYATWMSVIYLEAMGGKGLFEFPLETMHPVAFWVVFFVTLGMVVFHVLAFTNLFDKWTR